MFDPNCRTLPFDSLRISMNDSFVRSLMFHASHDQLATQIRTRSGDAEFPDARDILETVLSSFPERWKLFLQDSPKDEMQYVSRILQLVETWFTSKSILLGIDSHTDPSLEYYPRRKKKKRLRHTGYPNFRISGNPDFRKSGLSDFRTSGFPDIRISGFSDIRISGFSNRVAFFSSVGGLGKHRKTQLPDSPRRKKKKRLGHTRISENLISGHPEIRRSGHPDFRKSGYPEISGYPD